MLKKLHLKSVILLFALIVGVGNAWGDEEVYYTLTPASGSNNSYAANCDIVISGITWNLTGNSQMQPWRIGGKSLSSVDRTLYSKTAMGSAISKVEVVVGAASSITVNSVKLTVASDAAFSSTIDEVTTNFSANSTLTFTPTSPNTEWTSGAYYKFTFNVTVSGNDNKFLQFTSAKFYRNVVPTYALSFSDTAQGTITVKNGEDEVTSGDKFAEGTVLNIFATPETGYDFTSWSAASGTFSSTNSSSTTFTMPAEGVELTATFTAQSIVSDIELLSTTNGTISADKATANLGETVTLTATPNAGYVLSEWTVLDENTDEVDVVITGMNTATFVMPATDVLVDATFIKQHTITYSVNGTTTTRQYVDGATVDFSAPVSGIPDGYIFIGWRDNELDATDTNPDDYVTSATASADATYYAVFALPASYTEESWEKTELSALTSTDVFVFANGSKAMKNDDGDSIEPGSSSITISGTKITSEVADNLKFNVTGNATDGYTFFKNGSTDHLYCNTTTDSGNNNCIRVGEGNSVDRKLWVLNNSGYLITKDTPTRYLSFYNSSSFRGYLNTDNNPFTPTFYKYIAPEVSSYSDFRSSLTPEVLTISAAGMNTVYYATAMEVTGGIAYYANDVNDGKVVFVEFDGNVIPANTGAVIKGDVGDEVTLTLTEDVSFSETNLLLGSVSDELVEAVDGYEFFVLSDGEDGFGFYYPVGFTTEEMFINSAHKAYLKVSSSLLDGNGAKGLGIEWESTGVSELIKMNDGKADKVYNLAGQRVEAMQEGIYIIGGKKVVR